MCDCIKNLEKTLCDQRVKGKRVIQAKYPFTHLLRKGTIHEIPYVEIPLTLEGVKKPFQQIMIFNNCPFCGEEIKTQSAP